jgi:hypothetical protein
MQDVKDLFAAELGHANAHIEEITTNITRLQDEWTDADRDSRRDLSRSLGALASGLSSAFVHRSDVEEIIRTLEGSV